MQRFAIVPVIALAAAIVLGGCSSGSNNGSYGAGGGGGTTVGFQGNIFTGTYVGSTYTAPGVLASTSLNVDVNGLISGSTTDGSGNVTTLSGSISKAGNVDMFYKVGSTFTDELTGTAVIATSKVVSLTLTNIGGIKVLMTVNTATNDSEFAGSYTGTYTQSSGGGNGTVTLVISTAGVVTGSLAPAGGGVGSTVSGTITASGGATLNVTPLGGAVDASTGLMGLNVTTNASTSVVTTTAKIVTTSTTTGTNTFTLTRS